MLVVWMAHFAEVQQARQRELGRFTAFRSIQRESFDKRLDRWFELLGRRLTGFSAERQEQLHQDREVKRKLKEAGLETLSDQGRFVLIRIACYSLWPVITIFAWINFRTYYANVTTIFSLALLVLIPELWLSRKTHNRKEQIRRELPLVIDLTNLATSAGWDVSSALEKVIDSLSVEFPNHPLIKELRKARWLATSGYTWEEALDRVAKKLDDDTVSRVSEALALALDKGGDRSLQLSGIAQDAQRTYYAAIDKRFAAIPVKALIITVVLFLTYFCILLAPAMVNVQGKIL